MEHIVMKGNFYDIMQNRECIVFERTRDTEQRIHKPCAYLWVPCSSCLQLIITWIYLQLTRMAVHLTAGIFLSPAARKNNNTAKFFVSLNIACENIRFSSLFAAEDVLRGGTSATQRQKFHTDDANQCLLNKSGSRGVPNVNLFNFRFLLIDFGKVLCSSANEL